MTDFKQSFPKHNPFYCSAQWHLWRSGLMGGIYDLAGRITCSGTEGKTFFPEITNVSEYFGSSYPATTRAVRTLCHLGWLVLQRMPGDKRKHYLWVPHEAWALEHPGGCAKRELFHWQDTLDSRDSLVKRLYAVSNGRIRLYGNLVEELHKFDEEELVDLYAKEVAAAKVKKARGQFGDTKNESCLWRVTKYLRSKQRQQVERTPYKECRETP